MLLALAGAGSSTSIAGQSSLDLPRAIDPKVVRRARLAFESLAAGRAQEAADLFRELIARFPGEPLLHLGAAQAAYLRGQDTDARAELETVLQLAPDLAIARVCLGQVLHRAGELDEAIRTFEALALQLPADKEIASTLDRWRNEAEVHGRMRQSVGTHFTISFEGPSETPLAARTLESLEAAYWRIAQLLAVYPDRPVDVVLYTKEQFHDITRSPRWAAGAYDGAIRVPIRGALETEPKELDRVLAHEFTHALIFSLARRGIPLWLHEGVSAALEGEDLSWAEQAVRSKGAVRLDALEDGFTGSDPEDALLAYAVSALAGRRLVDEAGGPAVGALLSDLGSGVTFEHAFATRALQSFTDFQTRLIESYPPAQK
jgi:tetratricopeptide (TPR) repeat protein